MSMITSVIPHSFITTHHIKLCKHKFQTFFFNPLSHTAISTHKDGCCFPGNKSSRYLGTAQKPQSDNKPKMDFALYCSFQPGDLMSSIQVPDSWKGWLLGLLISVFLPILSNNWGPLKKLLDNAEAVEEKVEDLVENIEKVAEEVEKVAEGIADDLPEGGIVTKAVNFVENAAKEIVKDANLAEEFIDKVEEMEEEVEAIIESAVTQKSTETAKVASDQN